MNALSGVVLAAGLSSRMGAFKPLLEINGISMVHRVVCLMKKAGAEPVFVVTGYRHRELEAHLQDTGVQFVYNPDYASTQQMDSLKLALAQLEGRCAKVLISPADVPLAEPETVAKLLQTEGTFVRPVCRGKGGHPVLLSGSLIPDLLNYRGSEGLRGAIRDSGCVIQDVEVNDIGVLMDNDTPEDFSAALKLSAVRCADAREEQNK